MGPSTVPDTLSFDLLHPARVTVEVGPEGLLAVRLLEWVQMTGSAGLVHVARSETRAERLVRALQGFAPTLEVLMLPPWDCVPYDRAGPSPEIMGRRIATLRRLIEQPGSQRLLITTIDAAMQRLPPRNVWCTSSVCFRVSQQLQLDYCPGT